jgi:hypothetical protein
MGGELRVQLAERGADADRLDALTGFLRRELFKSDVEDVTALRGGESRPPAQGFDVIAVGRLLVNLSRSAEGMRAGVSALRRWPAGGERTRRTVRMEINGDVLELSQTTAADQHRRIELFVGRNAAGKGC